MGVKNIVSWLENARDAQTVGQRWYWLTIIESATRRLDYTPSYLLSLLNTDRPQLYRILHDYGF